MMCDDLEPAPKRTRAERISVKGIASVPLNLVSDQDAQELLAQHDRLIWFVLHRFRPYLQQCGAVEAGVEESDLHLIGQVALLRAWVLWEPARGAWSTIATTYIRRAISRTLGLGGARRAELRVIPVDPLAFSDPDEMLDGAGALPSRFKRETRDTLVIDPRNDTAIEQDQQRVWLRAQLNGPLLSQRQRRVVEAMLVCETYGAAAAWLGDITRQGVEVQYAIALARLRKAAKRSGFELP
jgi:hypothetical protein